MKGPGLLFRSSFHRESQALRSRVRPQRLFRPGRAIRPSLAPLSRPRDFDVRPLHRGAEEAAKGGGVEPPQNVVEHSVDLSMQAEEWVPSVSGAGLHRDPDYSME